jgi:hypothetical protein
MRRVLVALLAALGLASALAAPVNAATSPPVVRPSMTLHYVYNCTNPTVEADFKNLSGPKDVYGQGDNGIWLIAQGFTFDKTKVYDGYWHLNGVYQVDVFVTNPGAGPWGSRIAEKSTAATSLCPTYYPAYDRHWVAPTPPVGSVPIAFDYLAWWPNTD